MFMISTVLSCYFADILTIINEVRVVLRSSLVFMQDLKGDLKHPLKAPEQVARLATYIFLFLRVPSTYLEQWLAFSKLSFRTYAPRLKGTTIPEQTCKG